MPDFTILPTLLEFETLDELRLPAGTAETNVFRGALGHALRAVSCHPTCSNAKTCPSRATCPYARFFEPVWENGPSGYHEAPRPFVLRSPTALNSAATTVIPKGGTLEAQLLLFMTDNPPWPQLLRAFELVASQGLGPARARLSLNPINPSHRQSPLSLPTAAATPDPRHGTLRLQFVTPIELKGDGEVSARPDFPLLAHRLLDRIWALGSLYQAWPPWDIRPLLDLALTVRLLDFNWRRQETARRSSRTGQHHSIGGFIGWADYYGPIGAFLPLLEIARWTGVGRQTVWGKGQLAIDQVTWDKTSHISA